MRLPGLLRANFLEKIGGPEYTISSIESAFKDGVGCTAKVLWLPKVNSTAEPRPRWIRCTPLLGSDSRVGVWMVIVVPMDNYMESPEPSAMHLGIDSMRPSSRQSRMSTKSSIRSRSIEDGERSVYPIRTASILDLRNGGKRLPEFPDTRRPSVVGSTGDLPVSPLSDRDLYSDYIKTNHGPLPRPPRSVRGDGDTSRTASFTSASYQTL